MKYALGNMLNGAGGLNADGLSLDLQFATDKTLTARRGPTPVFTRASSGTFVGSNGLIQSAAINAARFDHDPVTLACRGLLIEEGRTNLYSQSEGFNDATWTKVRSSITVNATTAPDGTLTADKLVEDTTALNTHTLNVSVTPPATPHTLSVFAKKEERTWIVLRLGAVNTFFNLDNGTIASGSINTPTITNFGNGWYRCAVTSSAGTQGSFLLATNSTTTIYTGDGTSGLFLWGAQLEAGAFPTSYIPTTTASVIRSADVCSITGGAFSGFYNQPAGSLYCAAIRLNPLTAYGSVVSITDGTSSSQIGIRDGGSSATREYLINRLGAPEFNSVFNGAAFTIRKMIIAGQANDANRADSGVLGTNDFTVVMPTVNRMSTGNNYIISEVKYFKKRLPNAKLVTLTA